jgi:hypothetical protein
MYKSKLFILFCLFSATGILTALFAHIKLLNSEDDSETYITSFPNKAKRPVHTQSLAILKEKNRYYKLIEEGNVEAGIALAYAFTNEGGPQKYSEPIKIYRSLLKSNDPRIHALLGKKLFNNCYHLVETGQVLNTCISQFDEAFGLLNKVYGKIDKETDAQIELMKTMHEDIIKKYE